MLVSDIGYRTKVYSDIRYNVGLCALQSDIGRSNIRLSPISLITDIGVSAHLCSMPLFKIIHSVIPAAGTMLSINTTNWHAARNLPALFCIVTELNQLLP
jgi:hypothetical protein